MHLNDSGVGDVCMSVLAFAQDQYFQELLVSMKAA
jgi:hypothetical protein